jgi:hypothetical protein
LSEIWIIIGSRGYYCEVEKEKDLLHRIGCEGSADVEYLTEENVGALAAMLKPVPRRRFQNAWAEQRAMKNA